MWRRRGVHLVAVCIGAASLAWTQEPTYMEAATHPGAGQAYSRLLLSVAERSVAGDRVDDRAAELKFAYGLSARLAILLDNEFRDVSYDGGSESGHSLAVLRLKYRFWKRDLGPLNTWRASILAGVAVPGVTSAFAPRHPTPRLGLASTAILGRHGLNAEVEWFGYINDPDVVDINASHLYRISPREYSSTTRGAWYTMVESLNQVADNGDSRSDVAVGILFEAWRWAWEVSVRRPLAEDWPSETDWEITTGCRVLW